MESIDPYTSGLSLNFSRNIPQKTEDSEEMDEIRDKLDKIVDNKQPSRAVNLTKNFRT